MTRINSNHSFKVQENKDDGNVSFKGVHFKRGKNLKEFQMRILLTLM